MFKGSDSVPVPGSNLALLGYIYLLERFQAQASPYQSVNRLIG
jgi:hypothetical protein